MPSVLASLPVVQYRCPGEHCDISRSVHLARMAAGYPKCRECEHRADLGSAPRGITLKVEQSVRRPQRSTVFTSEGVRGVYLNELTREMAGNISAALASVLADGLLDAHGEGGGPGRKGGMPVAIGFDERPASPDIVTGIGQSLRRAGCRVVDLGLCTRACFWFGVAHLGASAGLHVTAAGSDPAWIGFDVVGRGAVPCSRPGKLDVLEQRVREGFSRPSRWPGTQGAFHAQLPYEAGLWKHFHALRPLRIVAGCSSRQVRDLLQRVFRKLACRLELIETPVRRRLPHGEGHPDLVRLSPLVRGQRAHLGVFIEEDGQTCAFLDEQGRLVPPETAAPILAQTVRAESPTAAAFWQIEAEHGEGTTTTPSNDASNIDAPTSNLLEVPHGFQRAPSAGLEGLSIALGASPGSVGATSAGKFWFSESFPTCDAVLTLAKMLQALSQSDAHFSEVAAG